MKKPGLWNIILVLITLLWGSIHPISKHVLDSGVDVYMMAFLRFLFAATPLIPFFIVEYRKHDKPDIKELGMMSLLGLIGVAGFSLLMYLGLARTNATSSAILINTQPMFAAVFSALIIREKLTVRHLTGIIIGLAGISLVATRGDFSALSLENDYLAGNLLCILAAVGLSYFYVGLKKYVIKFGSTVPTFITMAAGTVVLFIAALASGAQFRALSSVAWKEWLYIIYIGVIATALTFILFHRAITLIGVIRATGFKFLVPVFGVLLAILFLGEILNIFILIGIVIVLAAIAIIQIPGRKRNTALPGGK